METAHSSEQWVVVSSEYKIQKDKFEFFFLISSVFHLHFMARTKQSNQAER